MSRESLQELAAIKSKAQNKSFFYSPKLIRQSFVIIWTACALQSLAGCSLSEEMKRIEASRQYEEKQEASRSTDLTGDQIFIRSCNTCHPGGKQGMGPNLLDISEKYDDANLKRIIRKGKGIMPAQPPNVINDIELDRLVAYLKTLKK
jgi:mono/diheme cytochrome c family protein